MYVYPGKGQSCQQQSTDRGDQSGLTLQLLEPNVS